jgi:hypothetical protein
MLRLVNDQKQNAANDADNQCKIFSNHNAPLL